MDCLDPCEKEGAEPGTESWLLLTHNLLSIFSVHHCHFKVNISSSWRHQHLSFFMSCCAGPSQFSCAAGGIWGSFLFTTLGQPVWAYTLKIHKDHIQGKKQITIITTLAKCDRIAYLSEVNVHRLSWGTCCEAQPWYPCTQESHLINRSFTCALLQPRSKYKPFSMNV